MYKYIFKAGQDSTIHTPFCTDFSLIKQEVIEQTASVIKRKSIYPNGFEVILTQKSDEIIIETNKPLIMREDGTYDVQL